MIALLPFIIIVGTCFLCSDWEPFDDKDTNA
jgi:hypothetical protein